jgi:serine O-acetyltransferase
VARALTYLNLVLHSAEFHPSSVIGPGFVLLHPQGCGTSAGVRIGARCRMLKGVALGAGGYDDPGRDGVPVVGDDVLLCDGASVWGPVTIGDRSVVGAGVRLFKSVPADSKVLYAQRQMVVSRLDVSGDPPVAEVGKQRASADPGTAGDGARRGA